VCATQHVAVERVDLVAELGGERATRERQLHVVEAELGHWVLLQLIPMSSL